MITDSLHLHVACAIIESAGRILAAKRSATMSHPLKWEFPGGKLHPGEAPEECLIREIREEMGVDILVGRPLRHVTHVYPTATVTLYPFICSITSGEIVLHEHAEIIWLLQEELSKLDWAEADLPVIEEYLKFSDRKGKISA